jgi:dolichol-phosphate mannosyltransferase
MIHAMKEFHADFVMEFDADFQHPPTDIPRMIGTVDGGDVDYVIGSRFIPGGSIPPEWGLHRKFLSVVGNWVARICLFLPSIHDVTSGFKLTRTRGFLDRFDFSALLSRRFAYKVHLLYFMVKMGARVKEVPFHFCPRDAGESKIMNNEMIETLRVIWRLRAAGIRGELPGRRKSARPTPG